MPVNWGHGMPQVDIGQAAALGLEQGQKIRERRETRNALAALAANPRDVNATNALLQFDPALALQVQRGQRDQADYERKAQFRETAANALLQSPQPPAPASSLASPQPVAQSAPMTRDDAEPVLQGAMDTGIISPTDALRLKSSFGPNGQAALDQWMKTNNVRIAEQVGPAPPMSAQATGGPVDDVPQELVDPAQLPARADGLRLNPDALRELYRLEPDDALRFQEMVLKVEKAQLEHVQEQGKWFATAAYHLKEIRNPDGTPDIAGRKAQALRMMPQMRERGIDPGAVQQFGFTDQDLDRFIVFGQSLDALIDDDRADRRLDSDIADDQADNERLSGEAQSRNDYRKGRLDLSARGQDLASADRRRGQDMADARGRNGGGKPKPAAAGSGQVAVNPKTGKRVQWNGKDWVPLN